MLVVYEKQIEMLSRGLALDRFRNDMVLHLKEFSPRHAQVVGDRYLHSAIELGIKRAETYGVTNPGLLRFYVELMLMFGSYFDVDPLYPWVAAILRDPSLDEEAVRMRRLYDAVVRYIDAIGGPGQDAPVRAVRNLSELMSAGTPAAAMATEQSALEVLARIYPERCAYLGESLIMQLIRRGPETAMRHDMATGEGIALVIGMMFGIGVGFAEDPLWPWIQATLCSQDTKSPEQRSGRLLKRTQIYVDRALDYLKKRTSDGLL